MRIMSKVGRFAYKSIRLQVDSPTSNSFRLHETNLVFELIIQKNVYFQTRLVGLL